MHSIAPTEPVCYCHCLPTEPPGQQLPTTPCALQLPYNLQQLAVGTKWHRGAP